MSRPDVEDGWILFYKRHFLLKLQFGTGCHCSQSTLFFHFLCLLEIAEILGTAYNGENSRPNVECARLHHTLPANVVSYGTVAEAPRVLIVLKDKSGAPTASTGSGLAAIR